MTDWDAIRAELLASEHVAGAGDAMGTFYAKCACGWEGAQAPFATRAQAVAFAEQHVAAVADFLRED